MSARSDTEQQQEADAIVQSQGIHPWKWVAAVLAALTVLFIGGALLEASGRSFHIDEVATLSEGRTRLADPGFRSQHAWFLDAYHWLAEGRELSLAQIRLPAIAASAAAMVVTAVVAWAIGGHWAAIFAALATLLIPRFWVSAVEIRFYGFLHFFGALAVAGVYLAWRGQILAALVLTGLSGLVAYKFHPAAAPFHGLAAIAAGLFALWHCWQSVGALRGGAPEEKQAKAFHVLRLVALAAALAAAAYLAATLHEELLAMLRGVSEREGNTRGETNYEWTLGKILSHSYEWISADAGAALRLLAALAATALMAGGLFATGKARHWTLAAALILPALGHHITAYAISSQTLFSFKYLTSALPAFVLLAGVGGALFVDPPKGTLPRAKWLVVLPTAALLLLGLTGTAGLWHSFSTDPSNAMPIANYIDKTRLRQDPPRLLGPTALLAVMRQHGEQGILEVPITYRRESLGQTASDALALRPGDVYVADLQRIGVDAVAGLPTGKGNPLGPPRTFVASTHNDFTYDVYHLAARPVLAPGLGRSLIAGKPVAFLGKGDWKFEGPAGLSLRVGDQQWKTGDVISLEGPAISAPAASFGKDATVRLTPHYGIRPQRRSASFTSGGPINSWNKPHANGEHREFWMANNMTLGYEFDLPREKAKLVIESIVDAPPGGEISVSVGGSIVGVYPFPPDEKVGSIRQTVVEIPQGSWGQRATISITHLGENSARKDDNSEVRVLKLRALEVVAGKAAEALAPTPTQFTRLSGTPPQLPDGIVFFNDEKYLSLVNGLTEQTVRASIAKEGHLRLELPPVANSHTFQIGLLPVEPGTWVTPEVIARADRIEQGNLDPLIVFLDEQNRTVGMENFNRLPFSRRAREWERRGGMVSVPQRARAMVFLLWVNLPKDHQAPEGAAWEIQSVRFTRP